MLKLPSSLWRLVRQRNEEGQGLVEYAFILVLIAMVCLLIVLVIGRQTTTLFSNISSGLPH